MSRDLGSRGWKQSAGGWEGTSGALKSEVPRLKGWVLESWSQKAQRVEEVPPGPSPSALPSQPDTSAAGNKLPTFRPLLSNPGPH